MPHRNDNMIHTPSSEQIRGGRALLRPRQYAGWPLVDPSHEMLLETIYGSILAHAVCSCHGH